MIIRLHRRFQCVDHCVARHKYALCDILFFQVPPVVLRGAEMQSGNRSHHLSVHFFRERRIPVISSQPRFHMAHRNLMVKSRQRSRKSSGRIAVNQDQVRLLLLDHRIHAG